MSDEERINPGHAAVRSLLRILGPLMAAVGGIFLLIGMVSFFSAFGSFGPPRYFWCAFVGMPLLAVGVAMTKFGFMGAITRYQAGEIAPVGKDTFNYMAEGTRGGVHTIATAVGTGLARGSYDGGQPCPMCGHANDRNAKFCDECGALMSRACPSCGQVNDGDAKFCSGCGTSLA